MRLCAAAPVILRARAGGPAVRTRIVSPVPVSDPAAVPPPRLVLFQRDDCHLCDLALEVLAAARAPEFESVFIDGDAALEARYGERIPVLRDDARDAELDWPFDAAAVRVFLGPRPPGLTAPA